MRSARSGGKSEDPTTHASGADMRAALVQSVIRLRGISRPTFIPHIWHDEAIHPELGCWAVRLVCTHCDTEAILHPSIKLTDIPPSTSAWLREHIKCKRIHRGRTKLADAKEQLRRELDPNPWSR